jgi:hypothetical protein
MSKPQVIVTAAPDGSIKVETVGVVGPACESLSAGIEAALGKQTSNTRKPEYAQQPKLAQPAQATR